MGDLGLNCMYLDGFGKAKPLIYRSFESHVSGQSDLSDESDLSDGACGLGGSNGSRGTDDSILEDAL